MTSRERGDSSHESDGEEATAGGDGVMYIEAIDCERVGRWTKRTIRFGPGLNLVFGRNEAGKSTARRAIEALLFAPDGKDVASLAELTAPLPVSSFEATVHLRRGQETTSWRRKGTRVLLPDGKPLSEAERDAWLWGTRLVDFRALYSLDGEALRSERFLARKERGSFGALLLELETGGRDLGAVRASLEKDLEPLYARRGRSQRLVNLLEALKERVSERRQTERLVGYEPYARALEERDAACEALRQARARRAELQREIADLNQILNAPRQLDALDADEAKLAELALVQSRISRDVYEELERLEHRIEAARQQRASAMGRLEEARRACEGREPSAPMRAHGKEVASVLGRRAAVEGYEKERAPLENKRDGSVSELLEVLRSVGVDADRDWVLAHLDDLVSPAGPGKKPRRAGALREAAEAYKDRRQALVDARTKKREAQIELSASEDAVAEFGATLDVEELEAAIKEGPLVREARDLDTERASLDADRQWAEHLATRLGFAKPFDLAECAAGRVPNADSAGAIARKWTEAQREVAAADKDVERCRAELAAAEQELRAARAAAPKGVSREEIEPLRTERDAAIDACAYAGIAQEDEARFERKVEALRDVERRLDALVDRVLDHARAVEAIEHARRDVEARSAALESARETRRRCGVAVEEIEAKWATLWAGAAAVAPAIDGHDAWRREYAALLEGIEKWTKRDALLRDRTAAHEARRKRLLRLAGLDAKAAATDATIDAALDAECKRRRAHNAARERVLERQRNAREAAARAAEQLRLAEKEFEEAEAAFLERFDADVPAFVAREIDVALRWVEAESQLRDKALRARDAVQSLVALERAHEADVANLQATIDALVAAGVASLAPVKRAAAPDQLLALARAQEEARETALLETSVRDAEAGLERDGKELADLLQRWRTCTSKIGLGAPSEPCSDESRAFLARAKEMVALEDAIRKQRAALGDSVERLRERVGGRSTADIEADIRAREAALADFVDGELAAADARVKAAEAKVAEIEGTTTLAALSQQIEAEVAGILPVLDEILALAGALELLTEAERLAQERPMIATILETASCYLAQLTRGSFVAVEIDDEHAVRDHAHLAVVRGDATASRLTTKQLSDGTRDQLWLALRLAFLQHQLGHKRLPVVLDDVLVHFDDKRSKEALLAIAELARHTQVILFTHHPWVLELAREAGIAFAAIELEDVAFDLAPEAPERPAIDPPLPAVRRPPVERTQAARPGAGAGNGTPADEERELAERIVVALGEPGAGPLSKADIVARVGEASADLFSKAMKRLKDEGRVVQIGEKRGARYVLADAAHAVAE